MPSRHAPPRAFAIQRTAHRHARRFPVELRTLRQVATRLQAVVRQRTRLINQFHHLLALAFPELALVVKDIALGWVLELIQRYPTAQRLAEVSQADLASIPYLPDTLAARLLELARSSIASLNGATSEDLVRDQVRQLRDVNARQKRLETLLVEAYSRLPRSNHLDSIPGIGAVTAAVLTAFILDINRFATPNNLVAYFGVLPIEMSSGIDRDGQARGARRFVMSKRGNDLVRRYLWMTALSAVRCNPAVRALYLRVVAKHPTRKASAVGHAMRKLLHLVFAIWKTDKEFDTKHFPWEKQPQEIVDTLPHGTKTKTKAIRLGGYREPGCGPQAGTRSGAGSGHRSLSCKCSTGRAGWQQSVPRLRAPEAATVAGSGARAPGPVPSVAWQRSAATLLVSDSPRGRSRSHLQRQPGRECVPLLRQPLWQAG